MWEIVERARYFKIWGRACEDESQQYTLSKTGLLPFEVQRMQSNRKTMAIKERLLGNTSLFKGCLLLLCFAFVRFSRAIKTIRCPDIAMTVLASRYVYHNSLSELKAPEILIKIKDRQDRGARHVMRAACGMHAAEAFAFQGLVISPAKLVPVTLLGCLLPFVRKPRPEVRTLDTNKSAYRTFLFWRKSRGRYTDNVLRCLV